MLKELFKQEDIESHKQKFLKLYPSLGIAGTRLIPGAKELVNYLADHGHRLILISAKGQKNLDLSVEHLGLKFDGVFGGASGSDKARIMIENRTYLYIGDQLSDVSAANSANAKAVLVSKKPLEIDNDLFPHIQFGSLEDLRNSISSLIKK
jgi:phosphoglycolate phosphatase-like HAD superfamily hydrolase